MRKDQASKELDEAIRLLMRVVESDGVGLVRDERIRSALRELRKSRKGGQIQTARVVRAARLIAVVACEALIDCSNGTADIDEQ